MFATEGCTLVINADICGVGVRVSFYLQTFLLGLLVNRSWQDASSALWTLTATSFGLTIAAVAQASQRSLSLFQALQVSNLVWLANIATYVSLASYSRQKSRTKRRKLKQDNFVKLGATAQTLFSMTLTLYMWVHASAFSYQQSCASQVKYALFVFRVSALTFGRVVGLIFSSGLTLLYVVVTIHELFSVRQSRIHHKRRENVMRRHHNKGLKGAIARAPQALTITDRVRTPWWHMQPVKDLPPQVLNISTFSTKSGLPHPPSTAQFDPSVPSNTPIVLPHMQGNECASRPRRRHWHTDLDPMLLGVATQLVVLIYFIVSNEGLIYHNPTDHKAGIWGFGQILSLIVVIPSGLSVWTALRKHGLRRLHKKNVKTKKCQPKKCPVRSDCNTGDLAQRMDGII